MRALAFIVFIAAVMSLLEPYYRLLTQPLALSPESDDLSPESPSDSDTAPSAKR